MLDRLPRTLILIAGAAFLWLIVGVAIGIISAVRRGTLVDKAAMGFALFGVSTPVFWLGLVALFVFWQKLGILPGTGYVPFSQSPKEWFLHLIIPCTVLAMLYAAGYARMTRGNLLEALGEDYIRTARAKGLRERSVVFKHGVRSAITPIVTILGLDLGILLGGAILTETVFNIPGVGRLAYDAIQKSDLPTVQGTVLMGAFFIILLNLIVDIVYAFLDPRVRY